MNLCSNSSDPVNTNAPFSSTVCAPGHLLWTLRGTNSLARTVRAAVDSLAQWTAVEGTLTQHRVPFCWGFGKILSVCGLGKGKGDGGGREGTGIRLGGRGRGKGR